mmetsp:Transcript_12607/g.20364  ORF Transcript_12607/g.20364 Transcript_12607/m.20364 type:complete len:284 (-) Transcript_12607:1453-2304(-)
MFARACTRCRNWLCPSEARGPRETTSLLSRDHLAGERKFHELAPGFESLSDAHRRIPEAVTNGGRVVIVGDVHGCVEELRQLLDQVGFETGVDTAVFVGDLVCKGPNSKQVVELAREINALGVRGNHDHYVIENMIKESFPEKEPYKLAREVLGAEDLEWLKSLPLSLRLDEYGVLVVHAGMLPGTRPEQNSLHDLLHIRNVRADGTGTSDPNDGEPWANCWKGPDHIVFGHDAIRKIQRYPMATGLDSGAVYGGSLTALVLPEWELVSVDSYKTYKTPGKSA